MCVCVCVGVKEREREREREREKEREREEGCTKSLLRRWWWIGWGSTRRGVEMTPVSVQPTGEIFIQHQSDQPEPTDLYRY